MLIFNDVDLILKAALDGRGLALGFETQVEEHVRSGALIRVLEEWCPPYAGFYLYDQAAAPLLRSGHSRRQ